MLHCTWQSQSLTSPCGSLWHVIQSSQWEAQLPLLTAPLSAPISWNSATRCTMLNWSSSSPGATECCEVHSTVLSSSARANAGVPRSPQKGQSISYVCSCLPYGSLPGVIKEQIASKRRGACWSVSPRAASWVKRTAGSQREAGLLMVRACCLLCCDLHAGHKAAG